MVKTGRRRFLKMIPLGGAAAVAAACGVKDDKVTAAPNGIIGVDAANPPNNVPFTGYPTMVPIKASRNVHRIVSNPSKMNPFLHEFWQGSKGMSMGGGGSYPIIPSGDVDIKLTALNNTSKAFDRLRATLNMYREGIISLETALREAKECL